MQSHNYTGLKHTTIKHKVMQLNTDHAEARNQLHFQMDGRMDGQTGLQESRPIPTDNPRDWPMTD